MKEHLITNLEPHEKQSPVWLKLRLHLIAQRNELREKNDGPHDAVKTAEIRGQIRALTALLAIENDPTPILD